jgi:rsbT co-antagonist protein RsbR
MKNITKLLLKQEEFIVKDWLSAIDENDIDLNAIILEEIEVQSKNLLHIVLETIKDTNSIDSQEALKLRNTIDNIGKQWTKLEVKPSQISKYILLLSKVLLKYIQENIKECNGIMQAAEEIYEFVSNIAIYSYESFTQVQSEIISNQIESIKKTEIPILRLNTDTILIPVVGIIDSEKAMSLMRKTLKAIKDMHVHKIILDIEGVTLIDTEVANQLVKLESATRLMGAKMIISGFSPNVAETMVHLGIELNIPTTSLLQYAIETFES